ncbi:MAG: polymer-forming cytoskeletal protein [Candidatus Sungbacteria bacterium]|uniref:Polymer-forming cytoskeletal protein n=1 Tax=Candidatus Sungiibacteriota bacterium TaxID=2750080 RepID=A0A9D6LTR5_9BACT|nr:polymer-forming cytoskeletal protein [Candidatus Sungbacteria bacterium]
MKKLLILISALGLLVPLVSLAAEFYSGDQYLLPKGASVNSNLYIAGGTLNIEGNINGDLTAAGGNVNVNGNVAKSAMLAGGTINISGNVGDSLRVAGGEVTIAGQVKGDVLAAGGRVKILPGAVIGGDLLLAGGDIQNQGVVHGTVKQYTRKPGENHAGGLLGVIGFWWVMKTLMGIVLAFLVWYFFGPWVSQVVHAAETNFGKEILRGLLGLIGIPILVVVAFVTIIGIPIGVIGLLLYIVTIVVSSAVAAILLGRYVSLWYKKGESHISWQTIVIGVLLYQILKIIPFIGWLVVAVVFLATFGSIISAPYRRFFP